ncbi:MULTISPECIES: serine hydrolase [unclassified Frigoribacterium]|uniref:serine hydrolase domain-containing protein n=1 Tax=unclassified Frigoribacterium TaxID=2627005 RepID=UPI0006FD563E|nr:MULTISPECIES: serine hydrolase domain-containing protein [unclassified Frigoribacterium]KQO48383.1 serine hydrolase [Frigoribacterium sp. Leaf254]KQT40474.1 serine hydrolase [Frigoribacterium sp. Leaf415]
MITTPTREAPPSRRRHPRLLVRKTLAAAAVVALGVTLAGCASGATGATADPAPPAPPQHQPGGHSLTQDDVDSWLDGAVGSALQTTGIPGATVSVVADGELLTARGYGMADTGTGETPAEAVDPERTLFRVGSVSKVVSATAVMQLVEQGALDLDADVQQYLDFDLDTPKGAVTLRHLLTHTAGFEEVIAGLIGTPGSEKTLREAVSEAPPAQVFVPGTTPAYSNYGATLAGYVAERVSGVPFADLLQQDVFDRAGMTSSSFAQPLPADLDARLAHGYPDDSKPAVATEVVNAAPAGAMSATATDMARFMLAQLGDLPDDQALLQADTLAEMHRPALDADDLGTLVAGQRMDLAFFDDSTPGLAAFGHDGDTQVFHSAMRMFPEHDTGIFLSMNGSGRSATASLDLRTTVLQGFADRYLRDAATADSTVSSGSSDASDSSGASDADSRGGAGTVDGDAPATETVASGTGSGDTTDGPVAADLAGTYLSSRSPVTNPGALLALSGQTTVVPRSDGTVAVTPKPLGVTTGVYEKVGTDLWREVGGDALLATRTAGTDGNSTVEAISWGASFTMLRAQPWQAASAALPSVVLAVVVLLASVIVWPATALAGLGRRRRDLRAGLSTGSVATTPRRRDRTLLLSRLGQASTLLALVGWAVVAVQAMSFAEVSAVTLRVLQGLQLLGVVAIVPAALVAWRAVRDRRGWAVVTGRVLVLVSLVVLAGFAFGFRLIAPSVSF